MMRIKKATHLEILRQMIKNEKEQLNMFDLASKIDRMLSYVKIETQLSNFSTPKKEKIVQYLDEMWNLIHQIKILGCQTQNFLNFLEREITAINKRKR
ncbi:MAG: hypothetical protein QXW71_04925 [Thermoplasmata archaeon]